jgi:type III secretion protein J
MMRVMRSRRGLVTQLVVVAAALAGCGVELEHGLDERQANQITAILDEHGIEADKIRDEGGEGWKIVVPRGALARAFPVLESYDLPKRGRRGLDEALSDRGLLPGVGEEHARLESARGAELERTLERVPGVICARVHLALPDATSLGTQPPPRASVLLRTRGAVASADIDEAQVRALVSGAITGLKKDAIEVVFVGGQPPTDHAKESVGPLAVSRAERGRVVAVAASGLGLLVVLGAALLLTALRLSSLRAREAEDHSAPSNRSG